MAGSRQQLPSAKPARAGKCTVIPVPASCQPPEKGGPPEFACCSVRLSCLLIPGAPANRQHLPQHFARNYIFWHSSFAYNTPPESPSIRRLDDHSLHSDRLSLGGSIPQSPCHLPCCSDRRRRCQLPTMSAPAVRLIYSRSHSDPLKRCWPEELTSDLSFLLLPPELAYH